jgi:aspartate/glutamate racemase
MRNWDLTSAAAKLESAQKSFQTVRSDTADLWNDDIRRNVDERFLVPLDLRVKRVIDAIGHLAEVLATAQRDCEDPNAGGY